MHTTVEEEESSIPALPAHHLLHHVFKYSTFPLALLASNPSARAMAEGSGHEVTVSSNKYTFSRKGGKDQLICEISDAYGTLFTRWWLRKTYCYFGLTIKYGKVGSPNYVLSLGELLSLGMVERLEVFGLKLPGTPQDHLPFLGQCVLLEVFRLREVLAPLNELLTVLSACSNTLSAVELSHVTLPTLQMFALCPKLAELELRNTVIGSMNMVVAGGKDSNVDPDTDPRPPEVHHVDPAAAAAAAALAAAKPFSDLAPLRYLQKLDLSRCREAMSLSGLQFCASLRSLNLTSCNITPTNVEELGRLQHLTDLLLSRTKITSVSALSGCRSLEKLQLSNSMVNGEGIAGLETLPYLTHLDLSYTRVDTASSLATCPSLISLNLWKTLVTSAGLEGIGQIPLLEHLLLGDNTIDSTTFLAGAFRLKKLVLQSTHVTTESIAGLTDLQSLEEINLSHTQVTSIATLHHCLELRKIDAQNTFVDGNGLRNLHLLPLLEVLLLTNTSVDNLQGLHGCPSLRELNLKRCTKLRPDALEGLDGITTLEVLSVTHNEVCAAQSLCSCTSLRQLNLWSTRIDDDGLDVLSELQHLAEVDLAESCITSVAPFLHCNSLSALTLYSTPITSVEGLERLPFLKRLDLAGTKITSVSCLASCPSLEVLNISDTAVDDEGFQGMGAISTLRVLMLSSTKVSNLSELGACSKLEELFAKSTPVNSEGITFLECAASLSKVNLSYTQVAEGILRFAQCRRLTKLNLKCTNVIAEEVEALRSYLPQCNIYENAVLRDKKGIHF